MRLAILSVVSVDISRESRVFLLLDKEAMQRDIPGPP